MKDEESIVEYLLRVGEIVNVVIGLGENVLEETIVKKLLRSISLGYDSKISSLGDRTNLDKLTMDELQGILTSYEMRIGQEGQSRK